MGSRAVILLGAATAIAVWLREEASVVSAVIEGRRFRLDPRWADWPMAFAGYLQPAGLRNGELQVPVRAGRSRWLGHGDVSARVRLLVTGAGRMRVTEVDGPFARGVGMMEPRGPYACAGAR